MVLLDGKGTAASIRREIREAVALNFESGLRKPHLAAILVGNNPASSIYVRAKVKDCAEVGYESSEILLEETVAETKLLEIINGLNQDSTVDGIIVQLPLPEHINEQRVIEAIDPDKDVDGFHPVNIGRMCKHIPCLLPATPYGVLELMQRYGIDGKGLECTIVGRSHIVGSPMSILMWRGGDPFGNSTVTTCHRYTKNLQSHTSRADILIVAVGKHHFITADFVKEGAIVIDVGIHYVPDSNVASGHRIQGDVCFDEVAPKCSYITPVPNGIGPMTRAMLLKNTLTAFQKRFKLNA